MVVAPTSGPELDRQHLEACRRGEGDALHRLFEMHRDGVYSVAFYFSGDESLAKDLTQETFLRVFSKIRDFRGESSFGTWLYRIVANTCIDEWRARRRLLPFGTTRRAEDMVQDAPQERNRIQREVAEAVQAAVARLKPAVRLTVLLRYVEGLSYEEIAQALGCSSGTVGARLNRGHKILARRLAGLRGAIS
jgi:RNA polymerase sigma-70 factor (ECF subfamily)